MNKITGAFKSLDSMLGFPSLLVIVPTILFILLSPGFLVKAREDNCKTDRIMTAMHSSAFLVLLTLLHKFAPKLFGGAVGGGDLGLGAGF
jgi:hypothetical protein